ncbi:hypothetical protein ACOI8O_03575 [Bifidobacterium adolescentis]|uniref:hypothetical protein n=1 Tax=Bifidobacterium adolescentis TaxID=1680 RepID=UPI003CFDBEA0
MTENQAVAQSSQNGNGSAQETQPQETQSQEEMVLNICSKLWLGNIFTKKSKRQEKSKGQVSPSFYFFSEIILVLLCIGVAIVLPMWLPKGIVKCLVVIFLGAATAHNAYIEWRGDVTKEAIDRIPNYDKENNDKGIIAHRRHLALMAKALKIATAFTGVAIGIL